MTTLQEATYYAALVYFSLMIIAMIVFLITMLVLKSKISKAKRNVEQKIDILTNIPYIGKHVFRAIKDNIK